MHFHIILAMFVHEKKDFVCVRVCGGVCTDLPHIAKAGWHGTSLKVPTPSDSHPCPPVPGHAVPVVHPDALPHPPKPQATPAGEEGEQGGLHEEHAVSSPRHRAPPQHPSRDGDAPRAPMTHFHSWPFITPPAPAVGFGTQHPTPTGSHPPGVVAGSVSRVPRA